mmetsp:Transcript_12260/g.34119  ORF Transcript_12260/g.34119 Transcript_12260/m.34119 type:complete len:264 (+) Transcript_12260:139-930(+)
MVVIMVVMVVVAVIIVMVVVMVVVAFLHPRLVRLVARVAQVGGASHLVIVESLLNLDGQVVLIASVVTHENGLDGDLARVRVAGGLAVPALQRRGGLREGVRGVAVHGRASLQGGIEQPGDEAVLVVILEVVNELLGLPWQHVCGAEIVVGLQDVVLRLAAAVLAPVRGVLQGLDGALDLAHGVPRAPDRKPLLLGQAGALLVGVPVPVVVVPVVVVVLARPRLRGEQQKEHRRPQCGLHRRHLPHPRRRPRGVGVGVGRRRA